MNVHQIQMAYDERQDRILLRLSTREQTEFRFWLTRRFVKRLWGLLVKMLEQDESFRSLNEEARRALLSMQHEAFVEEGDFSKAYQDRTQQTPLGPEPVLLATARCKVDARGGQILGLHPATGQGIDLGLNSKLLHMLVKLLRDAVSRSDWDIRFTLNAGAGQFTAATPATPRTLN